MINLYMVRHGKTDWNEKGLIQGITDIELNQDGKKQIEELAKTIDLNLIDFCICSPLKRTKETADILIKGKKEIIYDDLIVERGFGLLEGTQFDFDAFKKYWNYKQNIDDNGVETIQDCLKRAQKFLDNIKKNYNDKNILIVSHGCFIKALHFCIIGYNENTDFLSFQAINSTLYKYQI